MNITAIIEARCGSTRLPGKVLMQVLKKPMLFHLIERLKKSDKIKNIVVATTKDKKDLKIVNFCKMNKINYYRGSENNVLKRVYEAAEKYKANPIVQITGDCPLIDPRLVDKTINLYLKNKVDFASNAHPRSYPDGMDVSVFSFKSFKKVKKLAIQKRYKEHVSLFYIENENLFKTKSVIAPKNLRYPKMGLTLDEKKDYQLIKKIFEYFHYKKIQFFYCEEILELLSHKRDWLKINQDVKRKGIPI